MDKGRKSRGILLLLGIIVLAVVSGCGGGAQKPGSVNPSESPATTPIGTNPSGEPSGASGFVLGENIWYASQGDGPSIIEVKDKAGEKKVLSDSDHYPSKPYISPNGASVAYMSPFEFEEAGEVWLYTQEHQEPAVWLNRAKLAEIQAKRGTQPLSPHEMVWVDDTHLLVLVGNQYGTVQSTVEVLVLNSAGDSSQAVDVGLAANQFVKEVSIKDQEVVLSIGTYDQDFANYTIEEKTMDKSQFLF